MKEPRVDSIVPLQLRKKLTTLRHDLHRYPELSTKESRTAERLEAELRGIGPMSIRRVAGTGILARFPGRDSSAPTVAIRGDIDALPIQEETHVDFASENDGVMHACGHDIHAAWTVGAAHLLREDPAAGDVLVLLQPAEETAEGATAVLNEGVLDGVAAIVGGHVDMRYPLGTIVAERGAMAASADEFLIQLTGSGAHAARPHEGNNPITGGAALVSALQSVVAQIVAPGTPAVITVATFNGGVASNIIPANVTISGSVRAVSASDRQLLHREIARVGESIAQAFGLGASVEFLAGTPPLVNEPRCAEWARQAARNVLGDVSLRPLAEPNLGGEDFAFYLERLAGCFFRVGGRASSQQPIPAHSSKFLPSDDAVALGAAVLAETARIASAQIATGGSQASS